MTLDEVKALGGKTLGTLSAIPRDEWEEMSLDRLRQMKAELAVGLVMADRRERRSIVERHRCCCCLSRALEKAEMGERIFAVIWADKPKQYLFASTSKRS
jgi:hypothetical protein